MLNKNKLNNKWLIIFVLVLSISISHVPTIGAQTETTISVAPAILDLAVKPGESTQAVLTIRNGGGFALPVSVAPKSLVVEDEIISNSLKKDFDASSWIDVENGEFLLAENEAKKVLFDITIPENASPGGHYAQISVRGLSLEQSLNAGASIVIPEVAVTVLITVAGDITASMQVTSDSFFPLFATPSTDYMTSFTVVNDGNVHDLLTPVMIVKRNGTEVYRQMLTSKVVLPNTKKVFNETLQLPDDFGVYEAYIEMKYSNGQQTLVTGKETVVVALRLWSIFGVAFLTIGSLYIYNHRKNLHNAWRVLIENDA